MQARKDESNFFRPLGQAKCPLPSCYRSVWARMSLIIFLKSISIVFLEFFSEDFFFFIYKLLNYYESNLYDYTGQTVKYIWIWFTFSNAVTHENFENSLARIGFAPEILLVRPQIKPLGFYREGNTLKLFNSLCDVPDPHQARVLITAQTLILKGAFAQKWDFYRLG